jgi:hypothetical protein
MREHGFLWLQLAGAHAALDRLAAETRQLRPLTATCSTPRQGPHTRAAYPSVPHRTADKETGGGGGGQPEVVGHVYTVPMYFGLWPWSCSAIQDMAGHPVPLLVDPSPPSTGVSMPRHTFNALFA